MQIQNIVFSVLQYNDVICGHLVSLIINAQRNISLYTLYIILHKCALVDVTAVCARMICIFSIL